MPLSLPRYILMVLALCVTASPSFSQTTAAERAGIIKSVDASAAQYKTVSKQIWEFAELGYHEDKSSALLQSQLKAVGFTIQAGVADEPTAFIAAYGSGSPVIAILAEFDALPGLSQKAISTRDPVTDAGPGHGCGHNLLGSGTVLAAVSVKEFMAAHRLSGTLRVYGTPAEEGGSGKVYMVRAGLFKDVDIVLHWHPSDRNSVIHGGMLALNSARFTFHGIASHAALAPDRGRSALDAVMLMGNGIEFMREHIPSNARIHYIVTRGGVAPNIVPDLAEMELLARDPDTQILDGIWDRILKVAEGAAMMTETTVEVRHIGSDASIIGNDVLAKAAQKNLEAVGGFQLDSAQRAFALDLQKSLAPDNIAPLELTSLIQPLSPVDPNAPSASTDVGDVSWNVPTIGFDTATFVPGVAAHTWQAAASAGTTVGQDGMIVAAKALALTAIDLFEGPDLVAGAKVEFHRQLEGKTYKSAIPIAQKPPLNYRDRD